MKPKDLADATVKLKLERLSAIENAWNRKEIREERRRIKQEDHKNSRLTGKREIARQLYCPDED